MSSIFDDQIVHLQRLRDAGAITGQVFDHAIAQENTRAIAYDHMTKEEDN